MPWTLIIDDTFTHADTSTGGAGTTTGVPTQGGWTDAAGGTWSIHSNQLQGSTISTSGYLSKLLARPSSENHQDSRLVWTIAAGQLGSNTGFGCGLRYQSGSGNYYLASIESGSVTKIYSIIGGTVTQLNSGSQAWTGGSYNAAHQYQVDFQATGASPTSLSVTVTDLATSIVVHTWSGTDSASSLQGSGGYIMAIWSGDGSAVTIESVEITTYYQTTGATISSLTVSANDTTGITITATTTGTPTITTSMYRSSSAPFTPPGTGTLVGSATGTSPSIKDTSPGAGPVYYRAQVVDGASTSALSQQSNAQLCLFARQDIAPIFVGMIGDSIGAGWNPSTSSNGTAPITYAGQYLQSARPLLPITINNQSIGGTTSGDWATGGTDYPTAKAAFNSAVAGMSPAPSAKYVFLMLGTNDAKTATATSKATYSANISGIASDLAAAGYTVILCAPIWINPAGSGAANWNEAANGRIAQYRDALVALDNDSAIRMAYQYGLEFFAANASLLNDGVHPFDAGYQVLGRAWAEEFERIAYGTGGGTSGARLLAFGGGFRG